MKIDALATPALVIDAGRLGLPFRQALFVDATVISSRPQWSVADAGLKAFGMDHGNPEAEGAKVWFCSDEHVTFDPPRSVADRLRLVPAHVDPTMAYHEQVHLVSGNDVLETWPVDLRGWQPRRGSRRGWGALLEERREGAERATPV